MGLDRHAQQKIKKTYEGKIVNQSMTQPLFAKIPNTKITAYDLFDKKHKRSLRNFKFRVGVYGILRKGNEILVERHPLLKKYGFPGGGIDIGEKIFEGLYREFKEETGLGVKIKCLIAVGEDMFTFKGEDAQGIFIYYEVEEVGGKLLAGGNNEDTAEVRFIELNKLTKDNTQRVFWKTIKEYKKLKQL